MKRKTRSVTGTLAYLKRKYVLTYREEKPTVFKIQVVRGGVIGKQDIVAYAANAAHVPETSVQLAMTAFFDAITYFCSNGHRVQVNGLGSFGPVTDCKTAESMEAANTDTIKVRKVRFFPEGDLKNVASLVTFKENESLSVNACGLTGGDGGVFLANGKQCWFNGYVYEGGHFESTGDPDDGMPDGNYASIPTKWTTPGTAGTINFGGFTYNIVGGQIVGVTD